MTLLNQFIKNTQMRHWFSGQKTIVLAISTGVDSMVMLDLFLQSKIKGLRIIVAYVDHQLRQSSVQETAFIKEYCEQNNIELRMKFWPIEDHPVTGMEDSARRFRYAFFADVVSESQADYVATAHHADDLAETMIMKLIRGGRLNSLVGIAPDRQFMDIKLIRPMLPFSKDEIRKYAVANSLKWFEDETNNSDDNFRNRIRHNVMPLLKTENSLTIEHMADYSNQLANMIAVNNRYIDGLLNQVMSDKRQLNISHQFNFDWATWSLIIQRWLDVGEITIPVSNDQVDQIVHLIKNPQKAQGEIDLGNQIMVVKRYNQLIITNKVKKSISTYQKNDNFMVPLNRWNQIEDGRFFGVFTQVPADINDYLKIHELPLAPADLPLFCRYTVPGDRFELEGGGHQKVARLLINQKVANDERKFVQVLVSNTNEILAVLGYRVAEINGKRNTNKYYLLEK